MIRRQHGTAAHNDLSVPHEPPRPSKTTEEPERAAEAHVGSRTNVLAATPAPRRGGIAEASVDRPLLHPTLLQKILLDEGVIGHELPGF
jgi:hypothetical protein